jgi:hypothetical protein
MIDIHIHTDNSDGRQTFAEVIQKARAQGINFISIADHDNVNAYDNIPEHDGITLLPAIEIYYGQDGINNEILGYGIDTEKIKPFCDDIRDRRFAVETKNMHTLVEIFKQHGFILSPTEKLLETLKGATVKSGRIILNDLLTYPENEDLANKHGFNYESAINDDYINNPNSSFHLKNPATGMVSLAEASTAIRNAGGLVFMAHVFKPMKTFEQCEEYLLKCLNDGVLDGVEAWHPLHTAEQAQFLVDFATKHNILISGGTDNHNPGEQLGVFKGKPLPAQVFDWAYKLVESI